MKTNAGCPVACFFLFFCFFSVFSELCFFLFFNIFSVFFCFFSFEASVFSGFFVHDVFFYFFHTGSAYIALVNGLFIICILQKGSQPDSVKLCKITTLKNKTDLCIYCNMLCINSATHVEPSSLFKIGLLIMILCYILEY